MGKIETEREIAAVPSIVKAVLTKGYYFSQLKECTEGERLDFNRLHLCMQEEKKKTPMSSLLRTSAAMSHP